MGCIHWEYPLQATLLERWDSTTSTFQLPIRKMTIMMVDIYRLYQIPIHGQWIYHMIDQDDVLPSIMYMYEADRVDTIAYEITLGAIQ